LSLIRPKIVQIVRTISHNRCATKYLNNLGRMWFDVLAVNDNVGFLRT